eukprot:TRINITY_DN6528_c0_g1_i2.p1 TRINITY_DN6528_c0_g1~~TRINITY_DN6528_c0_g1_i2.p1  ORF type:complete len:739 (+),score=208.62 TRINITY_DN6528_c0_g1_i2:294-2219(+)
MDALRAQLLQAQVQAQSAPPTSATDPAQLSRLMLSLVAGGVPPAAGAVPGGPDPRLRAIMMQARSQVQMMAGTLTPLQFQVMYMRMLGNMQQQVATTQRLMQMQQLQQQQVMLQQQQRGQGRATPPQRGRGGAGAAGAAGRSGLNPGAKVFDVHRAKAVNAEVDAVLGSDEDALAAQMGGEFKGWQGPAVFFGDDVDGFEDEATGLMERRMQGGHGPPLHRDICPEFNAGTCVAEHWPHKLTHIFYEEPGVHEYDHKCIYPDGPCRPCQIHPRRMLRYSDQNSRWEEQAPDGRHPEGRFMRVLTYNVLFNHYHREVIYTSKRHQALFEVLRESRADIMCLQEVQGHFMRLLMREDWVRRSYWCSADENCHSLTFSGCVILSRWPLRNLAVHDLPQTCGNVSPCVIGQLLLGEGVEMTVATAHLSHSNHDIRTCQLANLLCKTQSSDRVLLLGDFNVHAMRPPGGFFDAWAEEHGPRDVREGLTMCPERNKLAELMNMRDIDRGRPVDEHSSGRQDVILVRSRGARPPLLRTSKCVVGGQEPCAPVLRRRLLRLCRRLGKDPLVQLEKAGLVGPDAEKAMAAPLADDEPSSPLSDAQNLSMELQLRDTTDALRDVPNYLFPSDHFHVSCNIDFIDGRMSAAA